MKRSYPIPKNDFSLAARKLALVVRNQECDTTCPDCPSGTSCLKQVPTSFEECPVMYCATSVSIGDEEISDRDEPDIGAIVGSVVGGLAFIAIVTYLVWRFCIRPKRQYMTTPSELKESMDTASSAEVEKRGAERRDRRSSTHTVHSIASTVLTRASNIIQIAYIPGVTNRATPTSPTVLVPPVPPINLTRSNASSACSTEEPHFFVPGDLRDSTYSGFSGVSDRTSMARTSCAARTSTAASIASAVIPPPPITGIRGKAAIVSLKSNSAGSDSATPPVPSIDYEKYGNSGDLRPPPSPGVASNFSVGSTFLNNASASTATQVRPQIVRVTSKRSKAKASKTPMSTSSSSSNLSPADAENPQLPVRSTTTNGNRTARDSTAGTIIDDTPIDQGPFSDPPSASSTTSLSAVIEEATRRAARTNTRAGDISRNHSPFSDDHAAND